jgi:anaphase-promoting complex subunit 6
MACQQYEAARRYFGKATALERSFAPAWIAFGHAFAAQDESDQAMAAYRTAHRLFPGLHAPLMGMGQEYQRMNNLGLAEQCFSQAAKLCPSDPLVAHELGVLAYRNRQYEAAAGWLRRALALVPGGRPTPSWEATLVALGHTLRKLRQWDAAIDCYQQALGLKPGQPGTYSALGYAHHLKGDVDAAIEQYHKALGLRPEDAFTAEMLAEAMEESSAAFQATLEQM